MIDYKIIDKSISFYEKSGFSRVEAPWTVTPQISQITKPILLNCSAIDCVIFLNLLNY